MVNVNNIKNIFINLDQLYFKYHNFQFWYNYLYIESFSNFMIQKKGLNYLKLCKEFKGVCQLLLKIKNLIYYNYQHLIISEFKDDSYFNFEKENVVMLGSEELNVLNDFEDIKLFLEHNELYSIIDSNYELY